MREVQADLEPTFENVVQEFVAGTMDDLLFSNREVNFKFDFREKEALDFIEEQLNKYADGNVADSVVVSDKLPDKTFFIKNR